MLFFYGESIVFDIEYPGFVIFVICWSRPDSGVPSAVSRLPASGGPGAFGGAVCDEPCHSLNGEDGVS